MTRATSARTTTASGPPAPESGRCHPAEVMCAAWSWPHNGTSPGRVVQPGSGRRWPLRTDGGAVVSDVKVERKESVSRQDAAAWLELISRAFAEGSDVELPFGAGEGNR